MQMFKGFFLYYYYYYQGNPSAPLNISVTAVGPNTVVVSWSPSSYLKSMYLIRTLLQHLLLINTMNELFI